MQRDGTDSVSLTFRESNVSKTCQDMQVICSNEGVSDPLYTTHHDLIFLACRYYVLFGKVGASIACCMLMVAPGEMVQRRRWRLGILVKRYPRLGVDGERAG